MQTTKNLAKSISCEVLADVWWMLRVKGAALPTELSIHPSTHRQTSWLLYSILEFFASTELRLLASGDLDGFAGLRVATRAFRAFGNREGAEANQRHVETVKVPKPTNDTSSPFCREVVTASMKASRARPALALVMSADTAICSISSFLFMGIPLVLLRPLGSQRKILSTIA